MAVCENLGKEQFLAVLYLPTTTSNATIAASQRQGAALEYLISADSISERSMARMWKEGVAVNADEAAISAYAKDLKPLAALLKGPLVQGDKLKITSTELGVDVSLNDIVLGRVESAGLFDLLLQTWIGPVPPSTTFRESILADGAVDSNLTSRYRDVQTDPVRNRLIAQSWVAAAGTEIAAVSDELNSAEILAQPANEVASADDSNSAVVAALYAANNAASSANSRRLEHESERIAAHTPSNDPPTLANRRAPEAEAMADMPLANVQSSAAGLTRKEIAMRAAELAAMQSKLPDEPESDDTEEILAGKRYYDDVKRTIFSRIDYPERALRLGRESEVGINVLIDSAGNLMSVNVSEESEFDYFNKAAIKAVENAGPFLPPPSTLVQNGTYNFNMTVNFRLANPS